MLSWDRRLEGWIVDHRVGVLDPVAQGLSYAGVWAPSGSRSPSPLAVVQRRARVLLVTAGGGARRVADDERDQGARRSRAGPTSTRSSHRPQTSSFPSGHASTSFACATVLGSFAPRLRVPLYVLAALIALSRTYVGVHFPLDVLAGAAWGLLVGWADAQSSSTARSSPPTITPSAASRLIQMPIPRPSAGSTSSGM